jgi:hypothetical protein
MIVSSKLFLKSIIFCFSPNNYYKNGLWRKKTVHSIKNFKRVNWMGFTASMPICSRPVSSRPITKCSPGIINPPTFYDEQDAGQTKMDFLFKPPRKKQHLGAYKNYFVSNSCRKP